MWIPLYSRACETSQNKHKSCDNDTTTNRHATTNATRSALGNTRYMIHVEGDQGRGYNSYIRSIYARYSDHRAGGGHAQKQLLNDMLG